MSHRLKWALPRTPPQDWLFTLLAHFCRMEILEGWGGAIPTAPSVEVKPPSTSYAKVEGDGEVDIHSFFFYNTSGDDATI